MIFNFMQQKTGWVFLLSAARDPLIVQGNNGSDWKSGNTAKEGSLCSLFLFGSGLGVGGKLHGFIASLFYGQICLSTKIPESKGWRGLIHCLRPVWWCWREKRTGGVGVEVSGYVSSFSSFLALAADAATQGMVVLKHEKHYMGGQNG